ncbi:alpha/beta fold hydrolase [Ekhidna sp.]|uniref:alpha/beta fold hydrolase n=1 Tax=Ekhidna sp. TaxID=2608089 RepID=UPI003B510792
MKKQLITLSFITICISAFAGPAIKVEKSGSGEPILFLPGFTNPGSVWQETIRNMEGTFENHLISYAGFNGIQSIEMPWYSTIKSELIKYIVEEDLTDLNIIGHSMGGTLGADIAAELPDRIKRLIVVDGLPCMREVMMPGVAADQLQYESPYNNQMLSMTDEAFKQNASMMAKYMTFREDKVETLTQWILDADRKTYVYGYTDLLKLDIRESLSAIKAETLVIAASFPDAKTVQETVESQFERVPNKQILIAENSRHFIMFDQKDWFYEKVNSFLAK